MCLYDLVSWDAGLALQTVDVLGEQLEEQPFLVQQTYEGMGDGRSVVAGVQLLGEGVEGQRVAAEVANVEDGLGVGEVEAREVCVQARVGGPEVWNACRRADAGAGLAADQYAARKRVCAAMRVP
jgi:hypothetical protein